jgi:hypothetical protein
MPVNWKASVLFKTFIAYRDEYHNSSHSADRKTSGSKCSKSSIESAEIKPNNQGHHTVQSAATAANQKQRDDAIATLELQKMLLQNIAMNENAVKGLVNKDGERDALRNSLTTEVDLEEWKREMAQVLYTIWGPT